MRALFALLLAACPCPALADADAVESWGDAPGIIEGCLTSTDVDLVDSCIGRATEACLKQDLGAANPIQQQAWCAGAEQTAWQDRMTADITAIRKLLPQGPALQAFLDQQRLWQAYALDPFPYDRIDASFPWGFWGQSRQMAVTAARALQVDEIRTLIAECFAKDSDIVPQPFCDDIGHAP